MPAVRHLIRGHPSSADFDDGDFSYDLTEHGFHVGLDFRF
jgi:hypothetical protein